MKKNNLLVRSAVCLAILGSSVPASVFAEEAATAAAAPTTTAIQFDIAAQPLKSALLAFKEHSGIELRYPPALVRGLRTRGVQGSFNVEEALRQLLAGTELSFQRNDDGSFSLLGAAADAAADQTDEPAVISVTASRVESEIKDTPVAISVIGQKELDRIKFVDSTTELMKRVPGYSMIRNLRIPSGGKNYTINLIDGLAIGSAFGSGTIGFADNTNTFDIERVEVIRGPASALYGSNALGGVINVITRTPPREPEYRIWGEGGEYGRKRGGVSAAGSNDTLGYFFDANKMNYEGWQDRTANDRTQISGKLLFQPDAVSNLSVRAEHLDLYQESPGSLTQSQYDTDWSQASVTDAYNAQLATTVSTKYERDLDSRSSMEISYGIRASNSEGPPSYSPTGGFGSSDVTNQNMVGLYRHNFAAYRSQLIAGVDVLHSDSLSKTYADRTTDSSITQQWDVTAVSTSPFVQYELSPTKPLRLSFGARYDHIDYSAVGYTVSRGVTSNYDNAITFSHLSPKAGLTYELSENNSLWFGYAQGFVVPSRTYLFVGSRGYAANPDLGPEKAQNFELGLRGKTDDRRFTYDVALYNTDITDMLVADDILKVYVNAGKVRVRGVETTLGYHPSNHWRLDLAHTYAENKYVDYISGSTDYSGHTMSASPLHHFNTRVTWMPIRGLAAELEMDHITGYYTSDSNDDPEGKATRPDVYNLRVTYEDGAWTYWGHVLNVLDSKYAERISYNSSSGRAFYVGGPRTIYAGVSYALK